MGRAASTALRPRRPPGRPPGASGEVTREAILEAALESFAASGYDAMSVRELTRRLGVSHNLVHHYFRSKHALWRAAMDHGLGRQTEELTSLVLRGSELGDPIEALRATLERLVVLTARQPAVPRIVFREAAEASERLDYLFERYFEPALAVMERFLERARPAGIRDVDPRSLILLVGSSATALFSQAALARKLGGPDPLSPSAVARYARTVSDVLLLGLIERNGGVSRDGARDEPARPKGENS
jgi:AcrR family transcriptional regulator